MLNALFTLSEGQTLAADQDASPPAAGAGEFLRRTRLGYVVVDETRASPDLIAFAIDLLDLTLVSREGSLSLYVPRGSPPPAR